MWCQSESISLTMSYIYSKCTLFYWFNIDSLLRRISIMLVAAESIKMTQRSNPYNFALFHKFIFCP